MTFGSAGSAANRGAQAAPDQAVDSGNRPTGLRHVTELAPGHHDLAVRLTRHAFDLRQTASDEPYILSERAPGTGLNLASGGTSLRAATSSRACCRGVSPWLAFPFQPPKP